MAKLKIEEALKLRFDPGTTLADIDPASTPYFGGDEEDAKDRLGHLDDELKELQEMLFANGRAHPGTAPSVLVVLQGMDTSGKGGAIRHVFEVFDPQGTHTVGFGKPTEEELAHDFLWRIRKHDPQPGKIVAFDRSHYEDVVIQRVHGWVDEEEIARRFDAIRAYEKELAEAGVHIIKVFLHISKEFQKQNLLERVEREDKYWKYDPADVTERGFWDAYMDAYNDAIALTDANHAPWYILPSDNKPYARLVLKHLMTHALRSMDLSWPAADFDPDVERERIEKLD